MNLIFYPYLRKFVLVFFYDILIYNLDWHFHQTHITQVFEILKLHKFFIKRKNWAAKTGISWAYYHTPKSLGGSK